MRATDFLNLPRTKAALGARADIAFRAVDYGVTREFRGEGDECQAAHTLYAPLLAAGYRILRASSRPPLSAD